MKRILIIIIVLMVSFVAISLGVIYFIGNSKVDNNTNEQGEKQTNEIVENIKVENTITNGIESNIQKTIQEDENKEVKESTASQSDKKQQTTNTTTTTTKVEKSNKKTTQTTTTETNKNSNKSSLNSKSIDVELDKSTTYNIDDAGTATKGYLTEEQLKALGL